MVYYSGFIQLKLPLLSNQQWRSNRHSKIYRVCGKYRNDDALHSLNLSLAVMIVIHLFVTLIAGKPPNKTRSINT